MGKKADLVAAIQKEAERFEQLTGELGSQLNGFPKMKPFPREHNAQPYFESYYRECAGPAEQISNTWEAASTSHQNVARDVAALEKLLKAQKSNLFKKYSKGYKAATKFCDEAKQHLASMTQAAEAFEGLVLDPNQAPDGLTAYFRRRW